jgi:hypothetical protein
MRLVFVLSRALPAIGTVAVTAFFYWAGMVALPSGERIAALTPYIYSCTLHRHDDRRMCGWPAAASNSRLLIMVPFLDTVSFLEAHAPLQVCSHTGLVDIHSDLGEAPAATFDLPRRTRCCPQLQVLAMLGSLSAISFPSRVQSAISIANLANLDLVSSTAPSM